MHGKVLLKHFGVDEWDKSGQRSIQSSIPCDPASLRLHREGSCPENAAFSHSCPSLLRNSECLAVKSNSSTHLSHPSQEPSWYLRAANVILTMQSCLLDLNLPTEFLKTLACFQKRGGLVPGTWPTQLAASPKWFFYWTFEGRNIPAKRRIDVFSIFQLLQGHLRRFSTGNKITFMTTTTTKMAACPGQCPSQPFLPLTIAFFCLLGERGCLRATWMFAPIRQLPPSASSKHNARRVLCITRWASLSFGQKKSHVLHTRLSLLEENKEIIDFFK